MPTSIPQTLSKIQDTWSPHLVAAVNDQHVKIAKLDGEFIFHSHPDSDELFYLLLGELTMKLEGADDVVMQPGDVYVVPRGVRHCPVARDAQVIMVEKAGTINTGDETSSERTRELRQAADI